MDSIHKQEDGSPSRQFTLEGEHVYEGVTYSSIFPRDILEYLPDFPYKKDDIIIATYPKSGTTWMQEIMYSIVRGARAARIDDKPSALRVPFMEVARAGPAAGPDAEHLSGLELLKKTESPRVIKTHLWSSFFKKALQENIKTVVVLRNVKDVIVSYFHFYQLVFAFKGDFNEFFELFRAKRICHGDWFDWVLSWWQERSNPNVLFVTYEDMKADIHKEARRVCEFLGKDLSEEELGEIIDFSSFGKMKKRFMSINEREQEGVGRLRKGTVGNWKDHFNPEQNEYVDKLLETKLAGTGLIFKETL